MVWRSSYQKIIGLPIVFGYDDYTFSGLYDESYVVRLFEKNNFYVQKKYIYSEDILPRMIRVEKPH